MAKMINKTFYAGPMLFGTNVIVGNQEHGRTGKAFIKNIHIKGLSTNDASDKGIGSGTPALFGIESDKKRATFPCLTYTSDALRDSNYGNLAAVYPKEIYDSNDGESKWGYWSGSSNPRNRHVGDSNKSDRYNPLLFVIDPRDEEYQFQWDFSKEEDRAKWTRDNGDALTPIEGNSIQMTSGTAIEANIGSKLNAILMNNPSKKLRATAIEIITRPGTMSNPSIFKIGLRKDGQTTSTMPILLAEPGGHSYFGSSSQLSAMFTTMVRSISMAPLEDDLTKIALYHVGATTLRIYGMKVSLMFEEMLEAEPMFMSEKIKLPNPNFSRPSGLDYKLHLPFFVGLHGQSRLGSMISTTYADGATIIPETQVQFPNDAGKTWTAWVDNRDGDGKLEAFQGLAPTCNMYMRWKFKGMTYGFDGSTVAVNCLTDTRYTHHSYIDENKLGLLRRANWFRFRTNHTTYTSYQTLYSGLVIDEVDISSILTSASSKDFSKLRSASASAIIELEPSESFGSVSYDLNLPIELDEQFYMAYYASIQVADGTSVRHHVLGAPSYMARYATSDASSYDISGLANVVITGYILEE